MERQIHIEPVTRIEGHGKITVFLDDKGDVRDAQFHVTELRGFEQFCVGRTMWEMPGLTARICGICPVSHILASAKACDAILAVRIPETARLLRRLMSLAQLVQSHALSFFYLSAPDFLLGWDSDPALRNVVGLVAANPDLARKGIRLRAFGQEAIDRLGGKRVHPAWAVPGGVNRALSEEDRAWMIAGLPEARATVQETLTLFKSSFGDPKERGVLGEYASLYMGLVGRDGVWEHYEGVLRIVDAKGHVVCEHDPARYAEIIQEASEPWSYLKFPYYVPKGYPDGMYRVGPLGRVNACDRFDTPLAQAELEEFRGRSGGRSGRVFDYHYARLIEALAALEEMAELLADDRITSPAIRAEAGVNAREGVGVHEAPRGTLIHHYWVDKDGIIEKLNLIVSTGHNNLAMNRAIREIAKAHIHKGKVSEGILNRIEGGIRAYDPCLSCSVHAVGQMPLVLNIVNASGELETTLSRD
ncbi:MAG: Ni/Fe hydrogenase subunit alpha [Candidatus Bipolaricaulota bacterium]|nr:Ni/Fe hydrogenase subunit alpha [Candidatus Bipolaricaulota bacterium]